MEGTHFFNIEYFFNLIYYGFKAIVDFFRTLELSFTASWIVTILGFLFLLFVIVMVYARARIFEIEKEVAKNYKEHFKPVARRPAKSERWEKIERLFNSGNPNDWRVAIIEADTMLEELVTGLGYPGANLGEKLKNIKVGDFPTLQNAWEAHKVRNRIAHEGTQFELTSKDSETARRHFEVVFTDAGMI